MVDRGTRRTQRRATETMNTRLWPHYTLNIEYTFSILIKHSEKTQWYPSLIKKVKNLRICYLQLGLLFSSEIINNLHIIYVDWSPSVYIIVAIGPKHKSLCGTVLFQVLGEDHFSTRTEIAYIDLVALQWAHYTGESPRWRRKWVK